MGTTVKTVLMFVGAQCGRACDAVHLYQSVVPDVVTQSDKEVAPHLHRIEFMIGDASFVAMDSDGPHDFTFTPATSLWVDLASVDELERVAGALSDGGRVLMEQGHYGFSSAFTWVDDRFGVSWQLNVPSPVA